MNSDSIGRSGSSSPTAAHRGGMWRTLRFRLAVWTAGLVIITALVTLIGLRQGVRWALMHELDQVLVDDVRVGSPGTELEFAL